MYTNVWLRAQYLDIMYAIEQYRWEIRQAQTYISNSV